MRASGRGSCPRLGLSRLSDPYRPSALLQLLLHRRDALRGLVDDRRDERGFGAGLEGLGEVRDGAGAARCDDRHGHCLADGARDLEVVAPTRAVGVDRREEDLPRASTDGLLRPLDGLDPAWRAAAVGDDLSGLRVDRADDGLRAELVGQPGQELRVLDRRAVDRDLVRAGPQEGARVLERRDPAADGERDLQLLGGVLDQLHDRVVTEDGGGDVEEDELVRAEVGVARRELDGIAHVAQVLELDALDDPARGDVEAGDQALLDHAITFSSRRAPAAALRSGWNWTPARAPRWTAATTGPSWSTSARGMSSTGRTA